MRLLVLSGIAAAALAAPAVARADEEIVGQTGNSYANPNVTIDQGERLTFRNGDISGVRHDVASTANGDVRGDYLFASEIIGQGETSFVEGSQYLTAGSYPFFCTIHPNQMKGTLTVTGAGTPVPRPGSGGGGGGDGTPPAADTTPPEASIDYATLRAATIRKRRRFSVTVGADEAATLQLSVKLGKRSIGRRTVVLDVPGRKKVTFRLSRKLARSIKRGRRLIVAVDAVDAAGNPGRATDRPPLS